MSRDSGPNVFQRGVMALILLSLLRREDMYGYQLVQETERRSGGRLKTQEGSPVPGAVPAAGAGTDLRPPGAGGQADDPRILPLEPAGEARLEEMIREYESMMTGVTAIIRERKVPPCGKRQRQVNRYVRAVGSYLPCAGKHKKQLLTALRSEAEAYCAETRTQTWKPGSGTPQQVAAAYVDAMSTQELLAALRRAASGADDPDRGGADGAAAVGGGLCVSLYDYHQAYNGWSETSIIEEPSPYGQ